MALVTTTRGDMDDSLLEKREGVDEKMSDTMPGIKERAEWVEYWLAGELVHRSVHLHLIQVAAGAATGSF